MEKQRYSIDLQSQQISRIKEDDNHGIIIYATNSEIEALRRKFNHLQSADFTTFFRAHVPILPYHYDRSNDKYDQSFVEAAEMLYQLGDEETKHFIDNIGVLGDRPMGKGFK